MKRNPKPRHHSVPNPLSSVKARLSRSARNRHAFRPGLIRLEPRCLLSADLTFLGYQNHIDLTGPTASAGADGTQDLEIELSNLPVSSGTTTITGLTITGPSVQGFEPGFTWSYAETPSAPDNKDGGPNVQVVVKSVNTTETVDILFSSIVQQINPSTGQIEDLALPNNSQLAVDITYVTGSGATYQEDPTTNSQLSFNAGTTNPTPTDIAPTQPTLSYVPSSDAAFVAQQFTSTDAAGDAGITVSGLPPGSTLTSSAILSDQAGLQWGIGQSYGRPELGMSWPLSYTNYSSGGQNFTSATLSFPPIRDEAGTTMTLTFQLTGSTTEYVADISVPSGEHTQPALNPEWAANYKPYKIMQTPIVVTPTNTADMVNYTDSGGNQHTVDIQSLLDMAGTGTNYFELTDGSTNGLYQFDKPLMIHYPMTLEGADSNVDLQFTFSTAPSGEGAINFYDPNESSYHPSYVTLNNFQVTFTQSSVVFGEGVPAIIQDEDSLQQYALVGINISRLIIKPPSDPSFTNASSYGGSMDPMDLDGYETPFAIQMGAWDSGTIEDNTIYGGTVDVTFGPWTITGNHMIGSVPGTICPQAFGLHAPHDVVLQNNVLTNPDCYQQDEQLARLVTLNNGGYNVTIANNSVSDDVGLLRSATLNGPTLQNFMNCPEVILPEFYLVTYEGSTLATTISSTSAGQYNRRVISIPYSSIFETLASGYSSFVLFALDGASSGTAIPVTQISTHIDDTSGETDEDIVLASPLPQGNFDFSIAPTYNGFNVLDNNISTIDTVSQAVVLACTTDDVQVAGNTFTGDQSTGGPNSEHNTGIRVSDNGASNHAGTGSTLGNFNSYGLTLLPRFGIVIKNNIFNDLYCGIEAYESGDYQVPTTYGRTYAHVTIENNQCHYSWANTSIIQMGDDSLVGDPPTSVYSDVLSPSGTVVYDPNATDFLDPREMSVTASGNTIQWTGVTPPTTDVRIRTVELNGSISPYDISGYDLNPSPPILTTASNGPSVDLAPYFNGVAITTPGSTVQGYPETLSSSTLGGSVVSWNGQTFNLGPADANDVVPIGGQTIAVPHGNDTALEFLGMAMGYGQSMGGTFRVDYTDGSDDQYTIGLSNWANGYTGTGGTTAPGESIADTLMTDDVWNGTENVFIASTVYVYGYIVPVDPTRSVQGLVLPNVSNIKLLALDLVDDPPQFNLGSIVDQTSSNGYQMPFNDLVSLPPQVNLGAVVDQTSSSPYRVQYNSIGITADNNRGQGAFDYNGHSYSADELGNTVSWDGATFNIGPAGVNDELLQFGHRPGPAGRLCIRLRFAA